MWVGQILSRQGYCGRINSPSRAVRPSPTFLHHLPIPGMATSPLTPRAYLKDHPLKTKAECGAKWVGVVWGGGPEAREARIREADKSGGQAGQPLLGWGLLSTGLSWLYVFPTKALEVPRVVTGIIQALNPTQSSGTQKVITKLEWRGKKLGRRSHMQHGN